MKLGKGDTSNGAQQHNKLPVLSDRWRQAPRDWELGQKSLNKVKLELVGE